MVGGEVSAIKKTMITKNIKAAMIIMIIIPII